MSTRVGRLSSVLSIAPAQIVAAILLLAGFLPGAKADECTNDGPGLETCYGITNVPVYVGALVGSVVLFIIVAILTAYRRRRIQRANLAQMQRVSVAAVTPLAPPQHPAPTHNGNDDPTSVTTVKSVTLQYYLPPPDEQGNTNTATAGKLDAV